MVIYKSLKSSRFCNTGPQVSLAAVFSVVIATLLPQTKNGREGD